ncbi:MAG: PIN domain-containing protein [Solirubrobacterales bacterium]
MSAALLDTSVLIATETAIADRLPASSAISVISLAELRAGVRLARTIESRELRESRLNAVRVAFAALPVDEPVAFRYGELLAWARSEKRSEKATDLLISASAAATGRVLHTLDRRQASLAEGGGVSVELLG